MACFVVVLLLCVASASAARLRGGYGTTNGALVKRESTVGGHTIVSPGGKATILDDFGRPKDQVTTSSWLVGHWDFLLGGGVSPQEEGIPRPPYEERAKMARWLVHETSWGTLSTKDKASGEAVGGIVSHSDGAKDNASGRLFFYVTPMDELTQNVLAHPRCTYTLTEMQRPASPAGSSSGSSGPGGPCGGLDPEDPACARATLFGRMLPVPPEDAEIAREAMFARHPAMAGWPEGHKFEFYELHVDEVHVLDWYGGMAVLDGQEYYDAELSSSPWRRRRA
ncbi:hypothetical protein HYH03_000979 [Edaphochlamys debaryana]|uniref:CREG-like beta-barrel domain-containing protein n=1 Tax=Edaphochlamys debaryana TaxID=47281 RepID=A0A835YG70_9CHLO|nr:hypothetical protein HYH03_000979 [Edaphochlamys debaryana]|eukprot:KAG2501164.1 hypothetical protein HYH03_000979 [Edaphochlamys debaryana]